MKLGLVLGVLVVILLILFAVSQERNALSALPVPIMCSSQLDAMLRAQADGDYFTAVLGTGSMAPVIPPAPEGLNPKDTIVAYVSMDTRDYDDIKQGDLVSYKPQWTLPKGLGRVKVLHQAAQKDSGGWIMSGLNNKHFENRHRVTESEYYGVAKNIYLWPLSEK